ncbi:uncharacterized protein UV8b_07584 [Ustilaginoidea virens]|uniref:Uncharacterized protein n=1 Tax=Ustilaginoidea virens TaxID=1159556 RepID=A0A8E5MK71_USTVR|nr:uncharacterized protein UV8b_07584 [Ustilaginoidea virens]QUC23343.1 hypothetical protein UV8b_07584 [Ustilaginoidea virens]
MEDFFIEPSCGARRETLESYTYRIAYMVVSGICTAAPGSSSSSSSSSQHVRARFPATARADDSKPPDRQQTDAYNVRSLFPGPKTKNAQFVALRRRPGEGSSSEMGVAACCAAVTGQSG